MFGFVLHLMCRFLVWMLMTVLLIRTPGVVVLFRYIHSSTLFLQHPIGSQPVFCFQVCLLSKVIPRYVALSVCISSVSSKILFNGFDLFDNVKSVVKDLVVFIFTHQSCAHLDSILVASWSHILAVVAYYIIIKTKELIKDYPQIHHF